MERQSSQNQPSLNEINQMLSTPTVQLVMNGTQEDQKKNRSEKQNNSATPRKKRKTNTDPEETTSFPKQTPTRDLSLVNDDFDVITISSKSLSTEENGDSPMTPMETSQSDRDKCQFPNCHSNYRGIPSRCFAHMVTHGSRRFHCSECDYTDNKDDRIAQHLKGNCGGKIVDKLDQSMIDEWRQLSVICYPKQAKEIDALITKKGAKLLASSNLPIDRGAKCQFPNCQSDAQHDTESKCYVHLITHGPRRFTCSNCDSTGHLLSNIKKHFHSKTPCHGEIIDQIDQTMIDEWTKLATVCFPLHVSRLSHWITKKLAKSRDVQVVPKPIVAPKKEENEDCEVFFSPQTSSAKQNLGERIVRPQIEATQEASLRPTPRLAQSMNDVHRFDSPTTSRNASMQRLTQEVVRLRTENQRLKARAADEKNCKNVAHKLLGEKNTENEMQKEKIRQLQSELDKYVVRLD